MGAGLRTTSKGAERPPDPNVSCAAFLSRHPPARFDEGGVETEPQATAVGLAGAVAHLGPPRSRACPSRDRSAAHDALGSGGHSAPFNVVLSPAPMAHDSASPPAIPDGRISRVRF